jgi:hypothetical protein
VDIFVEDVSFQDRETGIQLTALHARDKLFGADFFAAKALNNPIAACQSRSEKPKHFFYLLSDMMGSRDLDETLAALQTQLLFAILRPFRGLCKVRRNSIGQCRNMSGGYSQQ